MHICEGPGPTVRQCIYTECSHGPGVEQLAVRGFWRGEQVYLSFTELSPNQLDPLGVESPLSPAAQLVRARWPHG